MAAYPRSARRRQMVAQVRRGLSLRTVAANFHVSVSVVACWVNRARGIRLDRVPWADRSHAPLHPRRINPAMENLVLHARNALDGSALGAVGASAIRRALLHLRVLDAPSVRTIARIVARSPFARSCSRTLPRLRRRDPPPRGWYLPDLLAGHAELDSFDIVEALLIPHGPRTEVLNGVSLHGGLAVSWPLAAPVTARFTVQALAAHWRKVGLPTYAQFDNDPIFQGTHNSAIALGRVVRLCLSLGVTPVFAPPGEFGFQSMVEGYNHWWQAKVWARFTHKSIADVQHHSARYVAALRQQRAARIKAAPPRRPFPRSWQFDMQAPPRGQIVYLRRTNANGELAMFGRNWRLSEPGLRQLVRVELDLTHEQLRFFSLTRNAPQSQPLLLKARFQLPFRRFRDRSKYPEKTPPA